MFGKPKLLSLTAMLVACIWVSSIGMAQTEDARLPLFPVNVRALRLAIEDLLNTFPNRYVQGNQYLEQLDHILAFSQEPERAKALCGLQRQAMLANPLLDFDRILLIKRNFGTEARQVMGHALGLPSLNAHTNDTIPRSGWDNEIAVLSDL